MHEAWIQLAEKLKDKVNVVAISRDYNKGSIRRYHVSKYPTIRLYKGEDSHHYEEYEQADDGHDLTTADFVAFLQKNGIDTATD
mmetsp:Transcript_19511/g.29983  ORF Transcript_19511/g.29983 Transcript_19511/m.29983 type:complete len:84 (-) Transcript_19511:89-340(-)